MKKMREVIYLKGKESVVVGFLFILALIVFFVPIALVMFFRFLFRMGQTVKEQSKIPAGVNADLERVY